MISKMNNFREIKQSVNCRGKEYRNSIKKKEKERGDTLILTEQRKECYRNAKRCRNESENLTENEKQIDNLREKNTETSL